MFTAEEKIKIRELKDTLRNSEELVLSTLKNLHITYSQFTLLKSNHNRNVSVS